MSNLVYSHVNVVSGLWFVASIRLPLAMDWFLTRPTPFSLLSVPLKVSSIFAPIPTTLGTIARGRFLVLQDDCRRSCLCMPPLFLFLLSGELFLNGHFQIIPVPGASFISLSREESHWWYCLLALRMSQKRRSLA